MAEGLPLDGHQHFEGFDRDTAEVARARLVVGQALRSWGLAEDVPDFQLVVSELVSNALVHGRGPIAMRLSYDAGQVRIEVSDGGGDTTPKLRTARVGGWGLRFVAELADSWGTERRGRGTLVWAVKPSASPTARGADGP